MNKKTLFSSIVALGIMGAVFPTQAQYHAFVTGLALPTLGGTSGPGVDWIAAGLRAISAGIKYFLADDTDLVAELVWKKGSGGCSGCGGCYGGSASANLTFNANSIPVEIDSTMYDQGTTIAQTSVKDLTIQRIRNMKQERASLDELDQEQKKTLYYAQQRSIQALANALVMKNAYKDLGKVAGQLTSNYTDYSAAASEIATKRLLLDELLALKKRVVAARVRTRAQTLEMSINSDATDTINM